ncbi:protein kinase [Achlya hypogyna]|uniref:Protein kinase n=1 Tax=Achlya hypogyna TaxID=1202772 RepID=A0A1V9ZJA7_ACHHY|nr:protein kinase [Achlya hypogyna]
MGCLFQAYASTFTCGAAHCADGVCCILDRNCAQTIAYAFNTTGAISDQIELVHALPSIDAIVFVSNGLKRFGLPGALSPIQNATVTSLTIVNNPSLQGAVALPSRLRVLNMTRNRLDNAQIVLPPSITRVSLDDSGLHSLLNVTFPATKLQYMSARHNLLTRFERVPEAEILDLSGNAIKLVRTEGFHKASTLILDNNPNLATVWNTGPASEHFIFHCSGCNITTFVVDSATHLSLTSGAKLPPTSPAARVCPPTLTTVVHEATVICVGAAATSSDFVGACPFSAMLAGAALTRSHCTTLDALYCVVDRQCNELEPFLNSTAITLDFSFVHDPIVDAAKFQLRQLHISTLPNVASLTIRHAFDARFVGDATATLQTLYELLCFCGSTREARRLEALASWTLDDPQRSVLPTTLESLCVALVLAPPMTSLSECIDCGWKIIPTAYPWPPTLKSLTLRQNQLLSFPSHMQWPRALTSFDVSRNQIEIFAGIPCAASINMSANNLHAVSLANFHGASVLDFSYNTPLVSVAFTASTQASTKLTELHLEGCENLLNITFDTGAFEAAKSAQIYLPTTSGQRPACPNGKLQPVTGLSAPVLVCVMDRSFDYVVFTSIVLAALLCLGFTAWVMKRCRRTTPEDGPMSPEPNAAFKAVGDNDRLALPFADHSLGDLAATMTSGLLPFRLNTDVTLLDTVLGRGAYGEVILGSHAGRLVAVKRLRADNYTVKHMEMLIQEIELMARFTSPHLVEFIGASWCSFADMKCIVEYMEKGDLHTYLCATKDSMETAFPFTGKTACMISMLRGLKYLHSQNVIHRDLKSRNVLLNSAGEAKLGDFGVAREVTEESMTNAVGTYRWTAPEVLKGKHYNEKADIYSFGMILTELDTHELPYADQVNERGQPLGNFTIMYKVMQGTITPTLRPTCPTWLRDVIFWCIAYNVEDRPSAADLEHHLLSIANEIE